MKSIAFKCSCGAQSETPNLELHSWAAIAALGDFFTLNWHPNEGGARRAAPQGASSTAHVDLLPSVPVAGSSYWVSLGSRFAAAADAPFWALYETPEIFYQGFDDSRARLRDLALALCRVERFEHVGESGGVAIVSVEAVKSIPDLIAIPEKSHNPDPDLWVDLTIARNPVITRQDDLVYIDARDDGMGGWALLRDAAGATDLLMISEYGFHSSHLWAGRLRVREGERWIAPPPFELAKFA